MRKIILLFFVTLSNLLNSQNKTIVPKSGAIVFVSKDSIYDQRSYQNSLSELDDLLKKQLRANFIKESILNGSPDDTLKLNLLDGMLFTGMSDVMRKNSNNVFKSIHEYKGDKIVRTFERNGIKRNSLVIDVKENHDPIESKPNEVVDSNVAVEVTGDEFYKYYYSKNKIESIKEDRQKNKKIKGYICFKVIYTFSEPKDDDFLFLDSYYHKTRELWVTEMIKSSFHPIIDEKEIIENYYPLEILEYSNIFKGVVTVHKVEKMNLN
jgi:hypothetical protein